MINAIRIENFKCFENQSIKFNGLTVLAGTNGVGKSTVIQSLLLIRQTIDSARDGVRLVAELTGRMEKELKIRLNDVYNLHLGNSKSVTSANLDSDKLVFEIEIDNNTIILDYFASKNNPLLHILFNLNSDKIHYILNGKKSLFSNEFHYLAAERIGPRDYQEVRDHEYCNTGHAGQFVGIAMYNAADHAIEESRCINIESNTSIFKKQIEAWMNLIVPGVEILPSLFENLNTVSIGIRKQSSGTNYLLPSNIGFGISYVLPIIVSGLIASNESVLIVENPEAHLHPAGQSKIGYFLAQVAGSGVQVILETHSEHVINGIRIASLQKHKKIDPSKISFNFFSEQEKKSSPLVESININETGELSNWPRGFFDQQERDLAEIFRSRK